MRSIQMEIRHLEISSFDRWYRQKTGIDGREDLCSNVVPFDVSVVRGLAVLSAKSTRLPNRKWSRGKRFRLRRIDADKRLNTFNLRNQPCSKSSVNIQLLADEYAGDTFSNFVSRLSHPKVTVPSQPRGKQRDV